MAPFSPHPGIQGNHRGSNPQLSPTFTFSTFLSYDYHQHHYQRRKANIHRYQARKLRNRINPCQRHQRCPKHTTHYILIHPTLSASGPSGFFYAQHHVFFLDNHHNLPFWRLRRCLRHCIDCAQSSHQLRRIKKAHEQRSWAPKKKLSNAANPGPLAKRTAPVGRQNSTKIWKSTIRRNKPPKNLQPCGLNPVTKPNAGISVSIRPSGVLTASFKPCSK